MVRDTTEPSVLAHEILNGRPFTFLDDAPLEERRSRAIPLRRGLPVEPHELGRLDPAAIERVASQVRPDPRDADELHDLLMTLTAVRPDADWQPWFDELAAGRRAVSVHGPAGVFWCAVERRPAVEVLFPDAAVTPDHPCPVQLSGPAGAPDPDAAAADMLRGHLDCRGPSTVTDLAQATGLRPADIGIALARLEEEGFAIRGRFTPAGGDAEAGAGDEEFCARRLLARIHAYTRQRQRREIEPVTARDFMRFLLRWQHVAPGTQSEGRLGVLSIIEQLQGYELAAGAWENAVLATRVQGYRREWLDEVCLSGQVVWGRLSVRDSEPDPAPKRSGLVPSRATPITLSLRDDLPWLLRAARGDLAPGGARAGPHPGRDRRPPPARGAVPARPGRGHRPPARRGGRGALGRRGPRADHRRRLPGGPLPAAAILLAPGSAAVGAPRAAAGPVPAWRLVGRPLVAAARSRRRSPTRTSSPRRWPSS